MRNSEHTTMNVTDEDLTSVVQRLGGTIIDLHPTGRERLDPLNGLSVTGGWSETEQQTDGIGL